VKGKGGGGIPRTWLYVGAGAVAAILAAVLIVVSLSGGSDTADPDNIDGTAVNALLDGIPQEGSVLGDPDAPVTMVEYADLQCPFCQQFSEEGLPALIEEYVRTGQLKIEFDGIAFIGPDSQEALRYAYAAGEQNGLWNFVELTFQNQGAENSDWFTEELARGIGAAIPGFDVDAMVAAIDTDAVKNEVQAAAEAAQERNVTSTPSFFIGPTGGELERFDPSSLSAEPFQARIDELLAELDQAQ
jgi:protein-disulfide isomerase